MREAIKSAMKWTRLGWCAYVDSRPTKQFTNVMRLSGKVVQLEAPAMGPRIARTSFLRVASLNARVGMMAVFVTVRQIRPIDSTLQPVFSAHRKGTLGFELEL